MEIGYKLLRSSAADGLTGNYDARTWPDERFSASPIFSSACRMSSVVILLLYTSRACTNRADHILHRSSLKPFQFFPLRVLPSIASLPSNDCSSRHLCQSVLAVYIIHIAAARIEASRAASSPDVRSSRIDRRVQIPYREKSSAPPGCDTEVSRAAKALMFSH